MRVFDNGSEFSVTATVADVQEFAGKWPCSGLRSRGLTASFDKKNGDLGDSNDGRNHPQADGGAVLALLDDMQAYGESKLSIRTTHTEVYGSKS